MQQYQQQAAQAQQQGQPVPPPDKYKLYKSSIPTNTHFDNDVVELKACTDWLNSIIGQQVNKDNQKGFFNVELHGLEHQANIDKKAMQQTIQQGKIAQTAAQVSKDIEVKANAQEETLKAKLDSQENVRAEAAELQKNLAEDKQKAVLEFLKGLAKKQSEF